MNPRPNEQHNVVPLLLPSEHGLPFAMTLEVFRGDGHQSSVGLGQHPSQGHTNTGMSPAEADQAEPVLELVYVLSGEGSCSSKGQTTRRDMRAGDSVLSWANTMELSCLGCGVGSGNEDHDRGPSQGCDIVGRPSTDMRNDERRLSALKFFLPLSLIQPQAQPVSLAADSPLDSSLGNIMPWCSPRSSPSDPKPEHIISNQQPVPEIQNRSDHPRYQDPLIPGRATSSAQLLHNIQLGFDVGRTSSEAEAPTLLSQAECGEILSHVQIKAQDAITRILQSDMSPPAAAGTDRPPRDNVLMQRAMEDFKAYRFPPPQTNTLAFFFDPSG